MTQSQRASVAVLGLGPMGAALARACLDADVSTTVWNRSLARADDMVGHGATAASQAQAAIESADLVVVCLRDHTVVREVLGGIEAAAYTGRTVLNLSSSTPHEARRTAKWATERGITYLTGAIMVPTPLIGDPSALILSSGDRTVFERHVGRLRILAGTADHLGEDPGLAALYDVGMLEIFFAGMTSFLHAAAMVTAQGVDAATFLPYARQIAALLPDTFRSLARDVDGGSYSGDEDRLAMELAALEHIAHTSDEVGLDSALPRLMRDLAGRAVDAGHGDDGFSRLVETLRRGQHR